MGISRILMGKRQNIGLADCGTDGSLTVEYQEKYLQIL